MNTNELCRLMKAIEEIPCVLPEEIEKGIFYDLRRVEKIDEEISDSDYKKINGNNYYRLYGQDTLENLSKEFSNVILISTHSDNKQNCSSYKIDSERGYVNGCFDNASTNAVCVYLMKYMKFAKNVLFAFTADEEYDSEGAMHVARKLEDYFGNRNISAIVLDVTYGFQNGADFTIENNYIFKNDNGKNFIKKVCDVANKSGYSWNFLRQKSDKKKYVSSDIIHSYMGEGCMSYTYVDGEDETSEYKKFRFSTFSLCLPCSAKGEKEMHSEKGFEISIKTISNYLDFLNKILQEL